MSHKLTPLLIITLAAMTSVTPLAIDTYLPAMPSMQKDLGSPLHLIELTIPLFLLFFAIGQIGGGILSDRLGRKKTSLIGLSGFVIASFALSSCESLETLYTFRGLQAFFGGLTIVNAGAIVRDLFHGAQAAKTFSAIASVTMIAPMIAPALGSLILSYSSWTMIFFFLALYGSAVFLLVAIKLPTTGIPNHTPLAHIYKTIFASVDARIIIVTLSLCFSGMFIFIEKSSFLYITYFHSDHALFPLLFGVNVGMMIIMTRVNIKLLQRYTPLRIMRFGILIQALAGLGLWLLSWTPSLIPIVLVMIFYIGSLGLIFGNGLSLALEPFPHFSGIANSLIGVTEFLIAGCLGFFASLLPTQTLVPIFSAMALTSFLAFILIQKINPASSTKLSA